LISLCLLLFPVFYTSFDWEIEARCERVLDGDTLVLNFRGRTFRGRIVMIDAFEMAQIPWGERGKQLMERLALGKKLRVERRGADIYGRELVQVFWGKQDLGLEMLRQGMALIYPFGVIPQFYKDAQAEAMQKRRGFWVQGGMTPWAWRKRKRLRGAAE